jgi:N-acetylglucosaminyldiphosphoundecaprenol N-acetyl-beta-D-mannosaminyltransferase
MSQTLTVHSRRELERNFMAPIARVRVGGIDVDSLTAVQWVDLLLSHWKAQVPTKVVTTANGQVLALCSTDPEYQKAVRSADHIAADGMSVVNGSKWFTQTPLPERVSTTDWFHDAAESAAKHGLRFYLLGATEDTITRAAKRIETLYPDLPLVGWRNGYFKDEDLAAIADEINRLKVDVLWLGIGNPRQVLIAHKLRPLLKHVTWIRTCGGLFDFLAQNNPRAPVFLQRAGFEWAWRAALEPRRLLWRYITTNIRASYMIARRSRTLK